MRQRLLKSVTKNFGRTVSGPCLCRPFTSLIAEIERVKAYPRYADDLQWTPHEHPDLTQYPLWQSKDLGRPMPDSPHACSVALPLWEHVVGYEEGTRYVINALMLGYPRFFIHPWVNRAFHAAERRFAKEGCVTWLWPNRDIAEKCVAYLQSRVGFGVYTAIDACGTSGVTAVTFELPMRDIVRKFWQHFGEIISSRQALDILHELESGSQKVVHAGAVEAKQQIKDTISHYTGQKSANIHLYSSGMAAISRAIQVGQAFKPGAKSIQLGFPYLDALKVQEVWGPGCHFYPQGSSQCVDEIEALLEQGEKISFCLTEFPGNPLLQTVDLERLSKILRKHKVPLMVDDTIASFYNTDLAPHADVILTSLTKWFNGGGNAAGGSLVLVKSSPFYHELSEVFRRVGGFDTLYDADALVVAEHSRNFGERMEKVNATTERLVNFLKEHPSVDRVYYPTDDEPGISLFRTDNNGKRWFGGMFAFDIKDGPANAAPFYDKLKLSKGPSLGNNFSMICPYTLLAHYDELEWVESLGISRYLLRVSVGQEDADDLISRFNDALAQIPQP